MFRFHSIDGCEIDRLDGKYIVIAPPDTPVSTLIAHGFSQTEEGLWGIFISEKEYFSLTSSWEDSSGKDMDDENTIFREDKKKNLILIVLGTGILAVLAIAGVFAK